MKNKFYNANKNGSILIFSLFVMMISLIIGVSLMSTSTVGRKSSLSSTKSVNSFQVADSAIEYSFREIREYKEGRTLGVNDRLNDVFGGCQREDGVAVVNGDANGGDYKLYFFRGTGGSTQMTDCTGVNSRIDQITKIKSVGAYNGIFRSVEADVDLTSL